MMGIPQIMMKKMELKIKIKRNSIKE